MEKRGFVGFQREYARGSAAPRTVFRNDPMHEVPLTRLALALQGWQGGLATHIVSPPIHDASHQTFKGMDVSLAAPDTGVRHRTLLHRGETCAQRFYQG
jgi:hypothetical protein